MKVDPQVVVSTRGGELMMLEGRMSRSGDWPGSYRA